MLKRDVKEPKDALAYLVDCQLATVEDLAMTRTGRKNNFKRHIDIAQSGVDFMLKFNVNLSGTRAHDVVHAFRGSVEAFAKELAAYYP